MGKGTRVLIAVLAGVLATILLLMAIFVAIVIFGIMQMHAMVSQMVANPQIITPTTNVTMSAPLLRGADNGVFRMLIYLAATSLGGLITALATYRLLGRTSVRE